MLCDWCPQEVNPQDWKHKSGQCREDYAFYTNDMVVCYDCVNEDTVAVIISDALPDGFTCGECGNTIQQQGENK